MRFDADRAWSNARQASTEDLLDRITVYRNGMEPEALKIVEAELRSRGIHDQQIETHARQREAVVIQLADGTAQPCSFCRRPAVVQGWGWHRLWGLVPLWPRFYSYCDQHDPRAAAPGL